MSFRILHVDDDPHIRDIVELSLGLDPTLTVTSCGSVDDALVAAADRVPDLILCDVMMPGVDGTSILARLRESAATAKTPVVFMTARAQARELDHLKALGAAAVITKPFDPMKLASTVRGHLRSAKFEAASDGFVERLRSDAALLSELRDMLRNDSGSLVVLERLEYCVHKLAGASGVLGFDDVSRGASTLEGAIVDRRAGWLTPGTIEASLDALLGCVHREMARGGRKSINSGADTAEIVAPNQHGPEVLIADDDPAVVRALADRCVIMGFEVRTALSGIQAMIMASQSQPDILIVDANMPEANGFDISARLLDQRCKHIDVVLITGSPNPEMIERCERLGAFYARKGPDFWNHVVSALAEIVPDMADRLNELAMRPTGVNVRTRPRRELRSRTKPRPDWCRSPAG
jgi:CheY-like chemotaxis protein